MVKSYTNTEYCFKGHEMLRYNLGKLIEGNGETSDFSCEDSENRGNGRLEGVICAKTGEQCHHYATLLKRARM